MTDRYNRIPTGIVGKGPNGRPLCRECGKETKPPRSSYCSAACAEAFGEKWPSQQAKRVLDRDKGVCEQCGRDCVALLAALTELRTAEIRERHPRVDARFMAHVPSLKLPRFDARCDELGLPAHHRTLTRRLWEMDHRVPVVEGGGGCTIDNLRTLCWACHRAATKALAARRAEARRAAKSAGGRS